MLSTKQWSFVVFFFFFFFFFFLFFFFFFFFFVVVVVLPSFQGYFTSFEPIVNQRWAKTGVPGENPADAPLQNLASHVWPERGAKHGGKRPND